MLAQEPATPEPGCAGSLDPSFNAGSGVWPPWGPTPFSSVTVQADGKVVIAGGFDSVQGVDYPGIARLNADGSLDAAYVPNPADAQPHTRVVQPDGRRIEIVPGLSGALPTVVRFNTDGSRDPSFAAELPMGFDARALALQPDGKLLAAGGVSPLNPPSVAESLTQPVVRLEVDGSRDPSFHTEISLGLQPEQGFSEQPVAVYDMVRQSDGRIYIGGFFVVINGVPQPLVARLEPDGTYDATFKPDIAVHPGWDSGDIEVVSALDLTPSGQLLIAGRLEYVSGLYRYGMARLHTHAEGCPGIVSMAEPMRRVRETEEAVAVTLTRSGATNTSATVTVRADSDGGGSVPGSGTLATAGEDFVARAATVTFAPGESRRSFVVELLDDAQLEASQSFYVKVEFNSNAPNAAVLGQAETTVLIYDDESVGKPGSVDETFLDAGPDGPVSALGLAPDGTLVVAGAFQNVGGIPRPGLARVTATGQVIAGFDPVPNRSVLSVAVEPTSAKLIIAGDFTTVNNVARRGLARLNADGSVDLSFDARLDGNVTRVALAANGRMVIAGAFSAVAGQTRRGFARLHDDGSLDSTFDAGAGIDLSSPFRQVRDLKVQSDGKVLLCGWFTSLNGLARSVIARLNADGSVDSGFQPTIFGPGDYGNALVVQPDGRILLSGWIRYGVNGIYHVGLVRLNPNGAVDPTFPIKTRLDEMSLALEPEGKIIYGGAKRLNSDGSEDPTWWSGSGVGPGAATAIVRLPDGDIVLGGAFESVNGFPYRYLARLNSDATPELKLFEPAWAGNRFSFSFLGQAQRTYRVEYRDDFGGTWQTWTNLIGNGATTTVTVDAPTPTRVFRVQRR